MIKFKKIVSCIAISSIITLLATQFAYADMWNVKDPVHKFPSTWKFKYYTEKNNKHDDYKFKVGRMSVRNKSDKPVNFTYKQTKTIKSEWKHTGKVEAEGELKAAIFAKITAKVGYELCYSTTTEKGTEYEVGVQVEPGKKGSATMYFGGDYSGGEAVWTIIPNPNTKNYRAYEYSLLDQSAWLIDETDVNFIIK